MRTDNLIITFDIRYGNNKTDKTQSGRSAVLRGNKQVFFERFL